MIEAFGKRLNAAADSNPNVPPMNYGRLGWMQEQMEKRGIKVTRASVSRWFLAEVMPMPDKIEAMAEILGTDYAWLVNGEGGSTPREKRMRNALASGVVNLVAGLIQMDGGTVAFPDEDDNQAKRDRIDIYAIIRGARYSFHVAAGEPTEGGGYTFVAPKAEGVVVLGLVPRKGFSFDLFEITPDVIAQGKFFRGGVEVTVKDLKELRRVESFADRI